ncbi:hypothetical protein Tco_1562147 [Tanacetum coccineum]
MIDELSIVETDKVKHTMETDMVKLIVEIECFSMCFDEFDKETESSDELQLMQANLRFMLSFTFLFVFCRRRGVESCCFDRSKELASPKQMALGKDFSNPLIVDSLLKTIWLSMHHVVTMKHWLFQSKRLLIYSMAGEDEFHDDNLPPPPPVPPTQQAPHTRSTIKLHILKKGEYDIWAMKIEHYLGHTDYPIWEVIQKGNGPVQVSTDTNGQIRVLPPKTADPSPNHTHKQVCVIKRRNQL